MAVQIDQRGHHGLSAEILHGGVLRNGNRTRLSRGDDLIAFDDDDRILDGRPPCSINQTRAFEHDRLGFRLRAGGPADNKAHQQSAQESSDCNAAGRLGGFHRWSPYYPWILVQPVGSVKRYATGQARSFVPR